MGPADIHVLHKSQVFIVGLALLNHGFLIGQQLFEIRFTNLRFAKKKENKANVAFGTIQKLEVVLLWFYLINVAHNDGRKKYFWQRSGHGVHSSHHVWMNKVLQWIYREKKL